MARSGLSIISKNGQFSQPTLYTYNLKFVGCENCPFLDMIDNPERANVCTSAFYEGAAALMDPRESWAAKWIRTDGYLPGVYAISITGNFDRDIEEDLESRGIRWRCKAAAATTAS